MGLSELFERVVLILEGKNSVLVGGVDVLSAILQRERFSFLVGKNNPG